MLNWYFGVKDVETELPDPALALPFDRKAD